MMWMYVVMCVWRSSCSQLHKDKDQDELWQYLEKRRAEAQAKV